MWNAGRIQQALAGVVDQADRLAGQARVAARPPVDERLAQAAAVLLRLAGDEPVTLQRLAAAMRQGVDEVRQAVLELEHIGLLVARGATRVVSVDELAVHARFTLSPG
jgi:predicted Rossmann fold nucleotide-binding protein DprA/Smf involved in DNA uptake